MGHDMRMLSTDRMDQQVLAQGDRMLQEHLGGIHMTNHQMFQGNRKLEKFQQIVQKAYGPSPVNASMILNQAKEHLESSELKILMLMLQMRGQFDRSGGPMVSKSSQTEGILVHKSVSATNPSMKGKERTSQS